MRKKGFSIVELTIALGLSGLLLLVLCGVFIYGLNSIKKGRLISTGMNLATRKIEETRNMMKALDVYDKIKGDRLKEIISSSNDIRVNNVTVDSNSQYQIWPTASIYATGSISIKGTADYQYIYEMSDHSENMKKVKVEISWEGDKKTGLNKVSLISLVSRHR